MTIKNQELGDSIMGSPNRRVIVVGLDGCSWNYLNKLVERGIVPYIKYILNTKYIQD